MPLDRVNLLDVDVQGDEATVLPHAIEMMDRKVHRIHLGTHNMVCYGDDQMHGGRQLHYDMARLFTDAGWGIVFDYQKNTQHETPWGNFDSPSDGIPTAVNPRIR